MTVAKKNIEALQDERRALLARLKSETGQGATESEENVLLCAADMVTAYTAVEPAKVPSSSSNARVATLTSKLDELHRLRATILTVSEIERNPDLSTAEYLDKCRTIEEPTLRSLPPLCLSVVLQAGKTHSRIASKELQSVLAKAGWPASQLRSQDGAHKTLREADESADNSSMTLLNADDATTFACALRTLVEIELLMADLQGNNSNANSANTLSKAVDDIVADPIVRRFRYHFFEGHNRGELLDSARPENLQWALRYITDALASIAPFVARWVQPAFAAVDPSFSVLRRISEALMREAARKVAGDFERIRRAGEQTADAQLLGAVTEIIWFQRDVSSVLAEPPSLLDMVFSAESETMMNRWIRAEITTGSRVLSEVFREDSAWDPEPITGVPRTAACAAELFASYTERYALLSSSDARKNFVLIAQKPVMIFLLDDVISAAKSAASFSHPELQLVRVCRLAAACIHCENALWEWINNELPNLFAATDSSEGDGSQCKKSMSDLVKSLAAQRKELIAKAVKIVTQGFEQSLRPVFDRQAWGTPRSELTKDEFETLEKQVVDVSEAAADGIEELRLGVRIALKTLMESVDSGRFLVCKFVKKCFERVNSIIVKGLAERQRTITKRTLRQFANDVKATVAALSEFDGDGSNDTKAEAYLAPAIAACDYLGGNTESAVNVDAQLLARIKKTTVIE